MIFHGPGSIEIGRSEQDPLYKLPVRRILGGMFLDSARSSSLQARSSRGTRSTETGQRLLGARHSSTSKRVAGRT
jgi:hypothetical protein